jgi:uncharacterized membrane protein
MNLKEFTTTKHFFRNSLAIVLIAFSIIYITLITFVPIPPENVRFADTIIGFLLGTIVSTIINYYYGSSKGSSDTNEAMRKIVAGTTPTEPKP